MTDEKWITTERFIVKGLLENDSYFRKVISNLKEEQFSTKSSIILKIIKKYYKKYDKVPQISIIRNVIEEHSKLQEKQINLSVKFLNEVKEVDFDSIVNEDWLFDETKNYVKQKSMYNFLDTSFSQFSDGTEIDYNMLFKNMSDIVSINWNEDLGIFYSDLAQLDNVFDLLSNDQERIPTGIKPLDSKIGGGLIRKMLLVYLGESGIGKTLMMTNMALSAIKNNMNVIYITFEIPREHIHLRYTAAFTDLNARSVIKMRDEVKKRLKESYEKGKTGELVIQEYAPGTISALDLDNYIIELKTKKQFKPDAIIVDYLGIMRPINIDTKGSYERGKEVCENLRWLSFKHNCPVISGSQARRSAYGEERVGMDDVSDSLGISMTADLIIGITNPPSFQGLSQLRFEIIKSRLSEKGESFIIPIDRDKLKLLVDECNPKNDDTQIHLDALKNLQERKRKLKDSEEDSKEEKDKGIEVDSEDDDTASDEIEKEKEKDDDTRNSKGIKIK